MLIFEIMTFSFLKYSYLMGLLCFVPHIAWSQPASHQNPKVRFTEPQFIAGDRVEYLIEIPVPEDKFFVWQNPGDIRAQPIQVNWTFEKATAYSGGAHFSIPEMIPIDKKDSKNLIAFGFSRNVYLWGYLNIEFIEPKGATAKVVIQGDLCSKDGSCKSITSRVEAPLTLGTRTTPSYTEAQTRYPELMQFFPESEKLRLAYESTQDSIKLLLPEKLVDSMGKFEFFNKKLGDRPILFPGPREIDGILYPLSEKLVSQNKIPTFLEGLLKLSDTHAIWIDAEPLGPGGIPAQQNPHNFKTHTENVGRNSVFALLAVLLVSAILFFILKKKNPKL
jgi:hypothetical protein